MNPRKPAARQLPVTVLTPANTIHMRVLDTTADTVCEAPGYGIRITSNIDAVNCPQCLDILAAADEGNDPINDSEPVPQRVDVDVAYPIRTPDDLRAWRARHKISLRRLAKVIDMHWITVHRWETGFMPIPRTAELALNYLEDKL